MESPVSTDADALKPYMKKRPADAITVVFSTYNSIEVVEKAMKGECFDLVLCDEAHRTTGIEGKSFFTRVHDDENIKSKKRLYMTATPRVYSDAVKSLGTRKGKVIFSMDDGARYGPEFHRLSFSDAVHKHNALADFKVKIAIINADTVDKDFQNSISDKDGSLPLDERTLLAAVWHGIQYPDDDESKPHMLQRVIAFSNRIDRSEMFAGVMKDTDDNDRSFESVVNEINKKKPTGNTVEVQHIDGKHRALYRRDKMRWLADSNTDPKTCRILSNAKCLSEGVDVPALDGVIFLNPRKSVVDVVQSVGRVMRKVKDKKFGYIILPVAIPAGVEYNEAMNDNKTFKIVWEVLNALRSHDESFAREINNLILDKRPENTGQITPRVSLSVLDNGHSEKEPITVLFDQIKSKIIKKVGDHDYYEKYGAKLGDAARTVEARIRNNIDASTAMKMELEKFHLSLKGIINDSVSKDDAITIVAQHVVLSRVFNELFSGEFTSHNLISVELDSMAKKFGLKEELEELEEFYQDVTTEVSYIDNREKRQNFIKTIYGNFFKSVGKKDAEKHGIVFTPVEIIDFIIHSVQGILQGEFNLGYNDRAVKVIDPFSGTGTFLTRLLESGYITNNLYKKYKYDLHANEMILLAYYIATVNIETTYASLMKSGKYVSFKGINYTDTLRLNARYKDDKRHRQKDSKMDGGFEAAHIQIDQQRKTHLHVIIGNPPYSGGQSSYGDNNQNIKYPELDNRIKNTFMKRSTVHTKRSFYDSYVRSIRWASDRISNSGIVGFVTNASFINSDTFAGLRASLADEFTDIWCFNLRGNQRTQGEISKKEGGKIFDSGSRTPIAILILVKNPNKKTCTIHYNDIGDYLTRNEKLKIIKEHKSIKGIKSWQIIQPDKHNDWINRRDNTFSKYTPLGSKITKLGKGGNAVFKTFSRGVGTSRDQYVYNSSKDILSKNMNEQIQYCKNQNLHDINLDKKIHNKKIIAWTGGLTKKLQKNKIEFIDEKIRTVQYRPFYKQFLYFDKIFNDAMNQIPKFFPKNNSKNLTICVPYKITRDFSVFITDITPDLHLVNTIQCFPLYIPENDVKDNITQQTLVEYQTHYDNSKITRLDIFYYVYGLLHHSGYRKKFANNLEKDLPHIPMAPDFKAFSDIGKKLADLHLNYEIGPRYPLGTPENKFGKFEKMSFARKKIDKKNVTDKTTLKINGVVVYTNIPLVHYAVGGRTPLEWAIDRYRKHQDKDTGMTNDSTNVDIIPLIERLVYVGVESDKLIKQLPDKFKPQNWTPEKYGLMYFVDDSKSNE